MPPSGAHCNAGHVRTKAFVIISSRFVLVSSQGWSDGLFEDPFPLNGAMTQPCPKGASRPPGQPFSKCKCGFGHSGELKWRRDKYEGNCTVTPCPQHSTLGKFPGLCNCDAPYTGHLQWHSKPHHHYSGECVRVPCPPFSRLISSIEELEVTFPKSDGLLMEEKDAHGLYEGAAALLEASASGRKPRVHVQREPRCGCDNGYVGGYMWHYALQQFRGGCMKVHPCPAGHRGAHPAAWVAGPWKFSHGWGSPKAIPQMRGNCEPAPCPPHAHFNSSIGLCLCTFPYRGNLSWLSDSETYKGRCSNKWGCPNHAELRYLFISTTQTRLSCVCSDGYRGGGSRLGLQGWRWHGQCNRVPCPNLTKVDETGLCSCANDQEGVRWSREHQVYLGQCRAKLVSTSAVSSEPQDKVRATTSSFEATTASIASKLPSERLRTSGQEIHSKHSTTTSISSTTRHLAPDQLNISVGLAMYVCAGLVACMGVAIAVQVGVPRGKPLQRTEVDSDGTLSFDWGYDSLTAAPDDVQPVEAAIRSSEQASAAQGAHDHSFGSSQFTGSGSEG